ncbi:hypothetical protein BJ878DRAFT_523699 [Calycina marina]|uniref:Uncharacterized protein n=1 Tax=Calycina marina TaxID=1763456 RepID=A0A9P7YWW7_9HELO|nr:hypothetical protein BJ878DRAFT_523699 [Calycina marina]
MLTLPTYGCPCISLLAAALSYHDMTVGLPIMSMCAMIRSHRLTSSLIILINPSIDLCESLFSSACVQRRPSRSG